MSSLWILAVQKFFLVCVRAVSTHETEFLPRIEPLIAHIDLIYVAPELFLLLLILVLLIVECVFLNLNQTVVTLFFWCP